MPTLARASPDRELERLIRLYLRACGAFHALYCSGSLLISCRLHDFRIFSGPGAGHSPPA